VRTAILSAARVVLLAGSSALAFFAGGYFDQARAWAGLLACLLAVIALLFVRGKLAYGRAGAVALAGLALLAVWTLTSILWAPIAGNAYHAGQLAVLYLAALVAASLLLRGRSVVRAVEPALVLGALVVVAYGVSERWLPGLLHFSRSVSANGRLEQPLTYWNAMGELGAIGFVLCARIAGDPSRDVRLRAAASAAAVPLAQALYLSFSRGALFACAVGLVALLVLAPDRESLPALRNVLGVGVLGALAAAPFHGVTSLAGSQSLREREGAITLALTAGIMVVAAVTQWRRSRKERSSALHLPHWAPWAALAVICVGLALAIVAGAKEKSGRPLSGGAARLGTLESNRYDYWRIALRAFGDQPLRGVGAGGWSVYWLRYRRIPEGAQDAHSLPLQTAAELGVVGVAFLAMFLGGLVAVARSALLADRAVATGPVAGCAAYIAHAPLDWDWQMPAVTLIALVLAGLLLGLDRADYNASAIRGASRENTTTARTQIAT
jgi:O-Antigen ligase